MNEKYLPKTRISIDKVEKDVRKDVVEQETKKSKAASLGPFHSGMGVRKRQPSSVSRRLLQDEAEEGQPGMRSEPKKSLSPEERIKKKSVFWLGYIGDKRQNQRPPSPTLQVTRWATADLYRDDDVTYIILAMRDFLLYAIYLTTLLMFVFGSHDKAYNYYANVVSEIVTKSKFECTLGGLTTVETFDTVRTPQQVWCFLEEVLMPFFYAENGTVRWILTENVLVGAPAMIQVRVKNDTCRSAYLFEDLYKTCYDYYHVDVEDRDTFGDGSLPFRWKSSTLEIEEGSISEGVGNVRGGYQFNFSTDYNFTKNWLQDLKNKIWIRPGTRFVVVDFALYSQNTNLFLVVKLDFKILPAGGVQTNSYIYTWKILRYVRKWDLFIMSCEAVNFMFVLYFTFEEAIQMWLLGSEYLTNWWNILDVTVILLSYMAVITATLRFIWTLQVMPEKINAIGTNNHANFDELIGIESSFITVGSILMFFAWIKLFKFKSLFKYVTLILTLIERVVPELTMMFLQVMVISFGFAIMGETIFGEHVIQFSTTTSSFFAMIGIYVGKLHFYRKCLKVYPILGRLYFGAYIILIYVVHLNVFVGLIVYGYKEALNMLNKEPQRQYMADLVFNTFIQLLRRLGSDRLPRKLLMKAIIHQHQVEYDEFIMVLKKHAIDGLELRMLLARYGLKRGNEMSFDIFLEIYNDLFIRHQLRIESEGHSTALELIGKTEQLLTSCNTAILDVQSKIDILLDKLLSDSSKGNKKKKKEPWRWF